ncbi:MAG: phosphatidate cytidylyltransferase [Planctomycetes bacterium]|nr:phosphatidate cytidylyltransferase [Planctomycetota bacterium]
MANRFLYGFLLIVGLVVLLYFDHATGWSFGVFALSIIALPAAISEIARLLKARGIAFDRNLMILMALATLCYAQFIAAPPLVGAFKNITFGDPLYLIHVANADPYRHMLLMLPLPVFLICSFHALTSRNVPEMSARLFTNLGVYIYLVFSVAIIIWLRRVPAAGPWLLYFLIAGSRMGDIGAYLFGVALGRHKLIPYLSPGKSIEGAIGGLVLSALGGALITLWSESSGGWLRPIFHHWWYGAVVGAVIGFAAQCGDLIKSAMKRAAGVKDSGAIVPAFGGVLDLVDNFMLTGPLLFLLIVLWP